jgi:hypothetical protein
MLIPSVMALALPLQSVSGQTNELTFNLTLKGFNGMYCTAKKGPGMEGAMVPSLVVLNHFHKQIRKQLRNAA